MRQCDFFFFFFVSPTVECDPTLIDSDAVCSITHMSKPEQLDGVSWAFNLKDDDLIGLLQEMM